MTYLGRIVGQGQVHPVNAKVQVVEQYPVPRIKKELMQFLGLVGYNRSFCKNVSMAVAALTDLLREKKKCIWSPVWQKAFKQVKTLICTAPVLTAPCFDRSFKLYVDASHVGVGAVLMQVDDVRVDRPVSFFSKKCNSCHLDNSVIQKDTLALILALKHFDVCVGGTGTPLMVYTDRHANLFELLAVAEPEVDVVVITSAVLLSRYSLCKRSL